MTALLLVRHGRPLIDRDRPADEWELDPAYADDVRALRSRLPAHAAWFSSPEPKALATAQIVRPASSAESPGLSAPISASLVESVEMFENR